MKAVCFLGVGAVLGTLFFEVNPVETNARQGLWSLEWSQDEKYFAFGGDDSTLYIYNTSTYSMEDAFKMHGPIKALAWHPKKNMIAISMNQGVQFYDLPTESFHSVQGVTTGGRGLDWNTSGELLALADGRGVVKIITQDGKLIKSIPKHDNKSYLTIHWHPHKPIVLTGSDEIIAFDTSGRQLFMLNHREQKAGILTVRWHPSGKFFALGDYGHPNEGIPTLLQFRNEEGSLLKEMKGSIAEFRNIRWNADGKLLATASDQLRIWNEKGDLLHTGKSGHQHNLWGISWSPSGSFLLTASFEGDIDLWDKKAKHKRHIP